MIYNPEQNTRRACR